MKRFGSGDFNRPFSIHENKSPDPPAPARPPELLRQGKPETHPEIGIGSPVGVRNKWAVHKPVVKQAYNKCLA